MPDPTPEHDPRLVLRQHEIAEAGHRILNPLAAGKLALLGELCRLGAGERVLDLCCGKGELLATWAAAHGIEGLGVDISPTFLTAARERAAELGVAERVRFVHGDAAVYRPDEEPPFDLVACIGATWIGGGLVGTLALMRPLVRPDGLLLVGEPFWAQPPSAAAEAALGEGFTTLPGTLARFEQAGVTLVEMVLAGPDDWDRYVVAQWWTVERWLRDHPDGPMHASMTGYLEQSRRSYVEHLRAGLGWGVFVLRP